MPVRHGILGPPTKADAAYEEIRNRIVLGTLAPGSRVDYADLAATFGLSVTPLREALGRLEADHLVVRNAHRDVVVAPLTATEAAELLAVREHLDVLAARLAAVSMTEAEIAAVRSLVQDRDEAIAVEFLRSAHRPVAVGGPLAVGRAFHCMIQYGSHNQILVESLDMISARAERYTVLARRLDPDLYAYHEPLHTPLIAAIEAHDAEAAEQVTRAYYDRDFVEVIFGEHSDIDALGEVATASSERVSS